MDEIEQRLRESAENCFKTYEAWRKNEKSDEARATLQDAVHELRKVASRLEIELAISERNDLAQRPIPIPPHRDARGKHQTAPGDDDDIGNSTQERGPKPGGQRRPQRSGGGHRRNNNGDQKPEAGNSSES